MKFDLIVSDPPWSFSDRLTMSSTKRGAEANYDVLDNVAIVNLDVKSIASDNSVLVLWVPGSLVDLGIEVMKKWGFRQTQTWIWVKTKKDGLAGLKKSIRKSATKGTISVPEVNKIIDSFDLNDVLSFYMGRIFRQCHEVALVGVRGKVYNGLANKSQRSVILDTNLKHSAKPEGLQDRLDLMFPKSTKLEMFARRDRAGYTCVGIECPSSIDEDIRDSILRLQKL